jgi:hypothetical protein
MYTGKQESPVMFWPTQHIPVKFRISDTDDNFPFDIKFHANRLRKELIQQKNGT